MLKKLLTGCLTIAMIGAFSASVSADTSVTWSGDATGTLYQKTDRAAASGAKTVVYMEMESTADLDVAVAKTGDAWTGTAYVDFDLNYDWTAGGQSIGVDDVYVKMSNDALAISFGEFDPVGIGKGCGNCGEIDNTYGAGGKGAQIPNEQGWLTVGLTEVGLTAGLGINAFVESGGDSTADDGTWGSMDFLVKFEKAFGDLGLGVEYVSKSTSRNENSGTAIAKKTTYDGLSASEIAMAIEYTLGEMGFGLNYTSATYTAGGTGTKANNESWAEAFFDMGFSDTMGISVNYGIYTQKQDKAGTDGTHLQFTFKMATDGVDHYVQYSSATSTATVNDTKSSYDSLDAKFGYSMRVAF